VTGALADGWIPSLGSAPPGQVTSMRDKIFASAAAAGRAPEEITCAYHLEVDPSHSAPDKPWVVSGPTGKIAETLAGFAGLGFTALSLVPGGPDRAETVQLLAAGGVGLGLSIVAAHEATVRARPRPEGGLIVDIEFPDLSERTLTQRDAGIAARMF